MCDKQLVLELADDVTKKKDRLRENLLAKKVAQHLEENNEEIEPCKITLTTKEKRFAWTQPSNL